jgi:hypothetical protein
LACYAPKQSSSASKVIYVLVGIGTPAVLFGCFVALRSFFTVLATPTAFVTAATCVAPLHSLSPSFHYHHTTFAAILMLHFMAFHQQAHKSQRPAEGATLSPAIISVGFSPPAASNFAHITYHTNEN